LSAPDNTGAFNCFTPSLYGQGRRHNVTPNQESVRSAFQESDSATIKGLGHEKRIMMFSPVKVLANSVDGNGEVTTGGTSFAVRCGCILFSFRKR
jgi:hypothetical protein